MFSGINIVRDIKAVSVEVVMLKGKPEGLMDREVVHIQENAEDI